MTEVVPIDQIDDPVKEPAPRRKRGNGKALALQSDAPVPAPLPDHGDPFLNLVARALETGADIDKMQKLLDMREQLAAQERERVFNDAFAAAQAEMVPVLANAENPQAKNKYATYDALDRALRPIYTKHGFVMTFNTGASSPTDVEVIGELIGHGHTRRYNVLMPCDGKGAKGGDAMNRTHAMGSAISYGKRYILVMAWNIAVVQKDDDGNAASNIKPTEHITEKQLADLNALIQKTAEPASNVQIIFQHYKIDNLAELTPKQFVECVGQLKMAVEARAND